jgi:hypothetical protein
MNVEQGLQHIHDRLIEQDADPATLKLVEAIMKRAALPAAATAAAGSHLQLVRLLMRTPVASQNPVVYNDLSAIEADLEQRAVETRKRVEEVEARPIPKLKKYYKKK